MRRSPLKALSNKTNLPKYVHDYEIQRKIVVNTNGKCNKTLFNSIENDSKGL